MILLLWTFTPNKSKTFFFFTRFSGNERILRKNITRKWLSRAPNCLSLKVLTPLTIFYLSKPTDFAASKKFCFVLENKIIQWSQESNRNTSNETTYQVCSNLQGFCVPSQVNQTPSLAFLDIPFHGKIRRRQFFRDTGILLKCFLPIIC